MNKLYKLLVLCLVVIAGGSALKAQTMNVTDGTNTYYADDATSLNEAVAHILEDGSRTFTVNLPSDAETELFTAIRRAIIDTEGVEDGSINLTLAGVEAIPDHNEDDPSNLVFGGYYGDELEYVTQLASVNLPDVISIGEIAFDGCENLVSVSAPKVQTIGDWAFASTGISELELPEVTSIGWAAFIVCQNLSTVILPKATNIGQQAFDIKSLTLTSLMLLSEDDIYIEECALGYPESFSANIDLVLNANKKDEVTEGLNWNGFTFKSISYSCYVTLSVNDENFGAVTGAGIYGYGEEATLTATPNEGYKFVNWTENDTVVSEETEFTFVVKGNRNFVANFVTLHEVITSVNDEEFGSVTGAGIYGYGEEATLVAIPNEGYKFLNWTENDTIVSEEAEFTFVVKGNRNFVANFVSTEGVDELTASFRLYPNPVNDKLYIETETEVEGVVVYDAFGRQQLAVSCQQSAISVSGLNAGVYFVMIKTNEGVVVKRFIKQ